MTEKLSWWAEINVPISKKPEELKKPEASKSNPKVEAFNICSRVFKNDSLNRIQDIEECFSIASQTPEATDFFSIITTLPEEELKSYFDAKKWIPFKDVCTNDEIIIFCTQFEKYRGIKVDTKMTQVDTKMTQVDTKMTQVDTIKKKGFWVLMEDLKRKHDDIFAKYGKDLDNFKDKPQSSEFQTAMKGLLSELKTQAKTPESLAEYAKFVTDFHSIGAVSEVDYAVLKREMEELSKGLSSKSTESSGKSSDYKLPEGFHESQDTRGVYTKYASIGESFDQVVTIRDGKGSKDIISPKSGYSVHLDNAVNLEEYNFLKQEASLRGKLGNITRNSEEILSKSSQDILAKNDVFIKEKEEKWEGKTSQDIEALKKAKQFKQETEEKITQLQQQKQIIVEQLAKLEQEKAQKTPVSGDIKFREEQAHETIQFVDNMGLNALGVENVNVFFDTIQEEAKIADYN